MRLKVRLFAMLREQAGWREREFELADGATIDDAWRAITTAQPALQGHRSAVRFAVNREYAASDQRLCDGDELAIIPPVAGGSD
jgi:molybdopterin converting factor subunit 1